MRHAPNRCSSNKIVVCPPILAVAYIRPRPSDTPAGTLPNYAFAFEPPLSTQVVSQRDQYCV